MFFLVGLGGLPRFLRMALFELLRLLMVIFAAFFHCLQELLKLRLRFVFEYKFFLVGLGGLPQFLRGALFEVLRLLMIFAAFFHCLQELLKLSFFDLLLCFFWIVADLAV